MSSTPPTTSVTSAGPVGPSRPGPAILLTLGWEAVLLAALILLLLAALLIDSRAGGGRFVGAVLDAAGPVVLLAGAFGLSLRAGVPNLAVSALAALGAAYAAVSGFAVGTLLTVVLAIVFGVLAAALVVGLKLPAWLVSTLLAAPVLGLAFGSVGTGPARVLAGGPWSPTVIRLITVVVILGSIGGGLIAALPPVRGALAASRRAVVPGWRGAERAPESPAVGLLVAAAVLVLSSVLAGLAGALLTARLGLATPSSGLVSEFGLLAVIAPVLGGTVLAGSRGGIAGTVLAVLVLEVVFTWAIQYDAPFALRYAVLGLAGLVGLVVTGLMGLLDRRLERPAAPAGV
jgi:hypothetical protein